MLDLAEKKIRNLLRKRRKCFKESAQFSGRLNEMSCIVFKRFEEQITIDFFLQLAERRMHSYKKRFGINDSYSQEITRQ